MQSTELSYRRSSTQGATGLGLMIALYDTLIGDLRRAIDAQRINDLEQRCLQVNHALLVIGYLEDCVERASGGELATKLVILYAGLRHSLIEAQVKRSPALLEQQMDLILSVRESWQAMELSSVNPQFALGDAMVHSELQRTSTSHQFHGISCSA